MPKHAIQRHLLGYKVAILPVFQPEYWLSCVGRMTTVEWNPAGQAVGPVGDTCVAYVAYAHQVVADGYTAEVGVLACMAYIVVARDMAAIAMVMVVVWHIVGTGLAAWVWG